MSTGRSDGIKFRFPGFRRRTIIYSNTRQTDSRLIYQRRTKPISSSVSRKGWGVRQYYSISAPESDWAGGLGIQFERSERRRASVMGTVGVESVLHPSKPDRLPCNTIRDKTPRGLSRFPPPSPLTHIRGQCSTKTRDHVQVSDTLLLLDSSKTVERKQIQ